jgi:hypothetical protein
MDPGRESLFHSLRLDKENLRLGHESPRRTVCDVERAHLQKQSPWGAALECDAEDLRHKLYVRDRPAAHGLSRCGRGDVDDPENFRPPVNARREGRFALEGGPALRIESRLALHGR